MRILNERGEDGLVLVGGDGRRKMEIEIEKLLPVSIVVFNLCDIHLSQTSQSFPSRFLFSASRRLRVSLRPRLQQHNASQSTLFAGGVDRLLIEQEERRASLFLLLWMPRHEVLASSSFM